MATKNISIFKNARGDRIPSVSTIVGQLDKPGLISWAHGLGLAGVQNLRTHRDAISKAGNLAHDLAIPLLSGIPVGETLREIQSEYEPEEIKLAGPILDRFNQWVGRHNFSTILSEENFVSDEYQFGGRIDWYGELDDVLTLIDFKFSNGLYSDGMIQVAAYHHLLTEGGYPVDRVMMVRCGREEREGTEEFLLDDGALGAGWGIFTALRSIYDLKKSLPKGRAA